MRLNFVWHLSYLYELCSIPVNDNYLVWIRIRILSGWIFPSEKIFVFVQNKFCNVNDKKVSIIR